MAKNSGIIQFTGKLGELVGAQGQDGRTIIRQRRYTIKNPKTDAQCAQRMIFATAGQAVAQLKPILNNSFEGKSFGAKSIQYARSLFLRLLRTAPSLDNNGMVYLPKGSLNFPVNAYPLSQGTLGDGGFVADLDHSSFNVTSSLPAGGLAVATASQVFSKVAVGHQISIVVALNAGGKTFVKLCRFAFKDDSTPCLIAGSTADSFKLNPAAIDLSLAEGNLDILTFVSGGANTTEIDLETGEDVVMGLAAIISDKIGGQRSTSYLDVDTSLAELRGGVSAAEALPTYADGASSLNLPSDYYLQNSVSVAE